MPMSLFRLPVVASTPDSPVTWRRMDASISFTVVLPLLPVTAISGTVKRVRQKAASRPSASRVSSTWRIRAPGVRTFAPASSMTALAPAARA